VAAADPGQDPQPCHGSQADMDHPGCDTGEVCAPPAVTATIEPDPAWHRALLPRFEKYRRLYAAVQPLFAS